jgi:hypothetical protein
LPPILVGHARYLDHTPDLALTVVPTDQHAQQLAGVEAIRFFPPALAFNLDARGIDHLIDNPLTFQETVQPKSIPARPVATLHRRIIRQTKTLLGEEKVSGPGPDTFSCFCGQRRSLITSGN